MNIEEIVNEHTREIIKNIFSKLDAEETYVILELNNQLQDKINKIDKAKEYIKETELYQVVYDDEGNYFNTYDDKATADLLQILGDK